MGAEQVTMPEGMVKGPDKVLPRNSVFKMLLISSLQEGKPVFYRQLSTNALALVVKMLRDESYPVVLLKSLIRFGFSRTLIACFIADIKKGHLMALFY
jgi:hypothetical protein